MVGLIISQAIEKFGKAVMGEQQLQEALADMMTDIFTAESVLVRIRQTPINESAFKIGTVFVSEKMGKMVQSAKQCLLYIHGGEIPEEIYAEYEQLIILLNLSEDIYLLKEEIATHVIYNNSYPF
ncbi:MAG: acyl-CoA/acyl-ACP dehydrogenase [Candidatus Marinimicrobia bacterium]|nr:acyl-CoA/acyl-ACP dehydrogenase [Candidatus Neomarinimicrobiota bacterium]MBT4269771.1 acyl-CoA/acyl-ACP dehydrogenase [Candidatus Neomarinimicrobiota bacterium]MBT4372206.1 acyl-CoA/acyl-ACP dehydrogenase [Candidatus Neomarinimicrobiota bacterium]MBT6129273.1 acyl-CoA/acyl-ACP dehydrogenase [Candidatus Neomarinimicrobiota bacterium]MBT6637027.1 acyl-CoA/acyl-ACP dehydrogenase [Candidatus Neomarinimicrobiota bacterium]